MKFADVCKLSLFDPSAVFDVYYLDRSCFVEGEFCADFYLDDMFDHVGCVFGKFLSVFGFDDFLCFSNSRVYSNPAVYLISAL